MSAPGRRGLFHWRQYVYRVIAREISSLTRYADRVIQYDPLPFDSGLLLEQIDAPQKCTAAAGALPDMRGDDDRTVVLLNGTFHHSTDIQRLLMDLKPALGRGVRIVSVVYCPYLQWLYRLANTLRIRRGPVPRTFLTRPDLDTVARLSGFEVVRNRPVAHCPFRLLGLGSLANSVLAAVPVLRWLGLVSVVVLR